MNERLLTGLVGFDRKLQIAVSYRTFPNTFIGSEFPAPSKDFDIPQGEEI